VSLDWADSRLEFSSGSDLARHHLRRRQVPKFLFRFLVFSKIVIDKIVYEFWFFGCICSSYWNSDRDFFLPVSPYAMRHSRQRSIEMFITKSESCHRHEPSCPSNFRPSDSPIGQFCHRMSIDFPNIWFILRKKSHSLKYDPFTAEISK
jgi:hypothetical protein